MENYFVRISNNLPAGIYPAMAAGFFLTIRSHFLGRTLIGTSFSWLDLFHYCFGFFIATALLNSLHKREQKRSRWDNIWVHGDLAAIDEDGMWYILGRSDDTLKVAGKRIGPAEIESVLVNHVAVVEAAVIGIPHEIKGNELVCFCVLKPNLHPTETLSNELKEMVVREMGKPMQPKTIQFISDLPKTRNAKVMRKMIRSAYLNIEIGDTTSLVNPQVIEEIRGLKKNS